VPGFNATKFGSSFTLGKRAMEFAFEGFERGGLFPSDNSSLSAFVLRGQTSSAATTTTRRASGISTTAAVSTSRRLFASGRVTTVARRGVLPLCKSGVREPECKNDDEYDE
jgi:hypothetical protein